jgi:aminoglycoside 3-N-acetyltransferase
VPETWWPIIRQHMPAFDPLRTPSNRMGVIAETFRTWPGTHRSSHPIGSLAAWGQHAAYITEQHPLEDEFGPSSPLGKVYELDGWVLLLGVGYKNNSSLHVAEYRAEYPGKRLMNEGCAILVDGVRQWVTFDTLDLYADDFEQIGAAFEAAGGAQLGQVGNAPVRLMRQRVLVDFAVQWMTRNRDLTHNEAAI